MRVRAGRLAALMLAVVALTVEPTLAGPSPSPDASEPSSPGESPSLTPSVTVGPSDPAAPSASSPAASPSTDDPREVPHEDDADGSGLQRRALRKQTAAVRAVDDSFVPAQITVDVGSTVTWSNDGQNPHTVTADDGSFGSGTLPAGDTFSSTFGSAGSFPYHCTVHGGPGGVGMSGVVVVLDTEAGGGGDGDVGGVGGGTTDGTTDLPATGAPIAPPLAAALVLATVGIASLAGPGMRRRC